MPWAEGTDYKTKHVAFDTLLVEKGFEVVIFVDFVKVSVREGVLTIVKRARHINNCNFITIGDHDVRSTFILKPRNLLVYANW